MKNKTETRRLALSLSWKKLEGSNKGCVVVPTKKSKDYDYAVINEATRKTWFIKTKGSSSTDKPTFERCKKVIGGAKEVFCFSDFDYNFDIIDLLILVCDNKMLLFTREEAKELISKSSKYSKQMMYFCTDKDNNIYQCFERDSKVVPVLMNKYLDSVCYDKLSMGD